MEFALFPATIDRTRNPGGERHFPLPIAQRNAYLMGFDSILLITAVVMPACRHVDNRWQALASRFIQNLSYKFFIYCLHFYWFNLAASAKINK